MEQPVKHFLFSNSSAKVWHTCRRLFYLTQLLYGRGISSIYVDEDLLFGTEMHELFPWLWTNGQDDELTEKQVKAARRAFEHKLLLDKQWLPLLLDHERLAKASEWGRLFEGAAWGLVRWVLPRFRRLYVVDAVESDAVKWLRQNERMRIGLIAKPDNLLRGDGVLAPNTQGYLELKTTGDTSAPWFLQWQSNPQSWTGAICLAASGVEIDWFQVLGIYKGVERDGRRCSPLCYLYTNGQVWLTEYTSRKGFYRATTDEYPGGIRRYVLDLLTDEQGSEIFPETQPVTIDWDIAEEWLRNQERSLVAAVEEWLGLFAGQDPATVIAELDRLFPRELSMCDVGPFRKPCVMRGACRGAERRDPLGNGRYRLREPHHPLEKKYWELEAVDGQT